MPYATEGGGTSPGHRETWGDQWPVRAGRRDQWIGEAGSGPTCRPGGHASSDTTGS